MVDGDIDSWDAMFDEKYAGNVLMIRNSREDVYKRQKEGRILFPPKASNCLLLRRHGLDNFDLTAIVAAALLAHSVRQVQSTALGACNETGDSQLPGGAASLIASCFGYFSLRYCHCDTSLIYKGQAALFILYLFSKSFARTARRGSTSFLQEQGPRFRSVSYTHLQVDLGLRHDRPHTEQLLNVDDADAAQFDVVADDLRCRADQLVGHKANLNGVIRHQTVTAHDQFDGGFALADTGITGDHNAFAVNVQQNAVPGDAGSLSLIHIS